MLKSPEPASESSCVELPLVMGGGQCRRWNNPKNNFFLRSFGSKYNLNNSRSWKWEPALVTMPSRWVSLTRARLFLMRSRADSCWASSVSLSSSSLSPETNTHVELYLAKDSYILAKLSHLYRACFVRLVPPPTTSNSDLSKNKYLLDDAMSTS